MRNRANILGVKFDHVTMKQSTEKIIRFLDEDVCRSVYTANPEFVMEAYEDKTFKDTVNKGDMVLADGIGIIIGSKLIKRGLLERVSGYDLVQNLFSTIKNMDKTVYFFGAEPLVAESAAKKMMELHKGLSVIGVRNGYYTEQEEIEIVNEINKKCPDLLLVGLGMKRQEAFIHKYRNQLKVKVCIGVGGCFDVMSGKFKRAPDIFIRLGLEWFYRLITQPSRFFRMLKLPLFLVKIVLEGKKFL